MSNPISNSDDIIDSRDVIARIEELEDERTMFAEDAEHEAVESGESKEDAAIAGITAYAEWDESDNGQELAALESLAAEAEGYAPDWNHGESLIRDSWFQTYAEELADDIGAIDRNAKWPCNHINWKQAAEELQQDYTSVDFDGVTYWIR